MLRNRNQSSITIPTPALLAGLLFGINKDKLMDTDWQDTLMAAFIYRGSNSVPPNWVALYTPTAVSS
jgi:hypothetical protein